MLRKKTTTTEKEPGTTGRGIHMHIIISISSSSSPPPPPKYSPAVQAAALTTLPLKPLYFHEPRVRGLLDADNFLFRDIFLTPSRKSQMRIYVEMGMIRSSQREIISPDPPRFLWREPGME